MNCIECGSLLLIKIDFDLRPAFLFMAKQTAGAPKPQKKAEVRTELFLFSKENYLILFAGIVIVTIGFLLMTGGHQSPDQWKPEEIYSFRRISLSTLFVIGGFVVILFSIFIRKKKSIAE